MRSRSTARVPLLLSPCGQGGEDRRARRQIHLRRSGQPRIAADRRPIKVLPKHWWEGTDARAASATSGDHAGAAARSGPYRIKDFVAGRSIALERVKDYWGQDSPSTSAATISTSCATNIFRDVMVALEAFKADQIDWRTENSAKEWATAYDFPAVRTGGCSRKNSRSELGRMQASSSTCAATVQGSAAAPRLQLRVRFRGDEQADLLRPVQAHQQLFRGHRTRVDGLAGGQELEILETLRDKVPAEVFTRPTPIRSAASRKRCAPICAKRLRLLKEAGYEVRDRKLVESSRRAVHRRNPGARPARRAHLLFLQAFAGAARHRRVAPHGR